MSMLNLTNSTLNDLCNVSDSTTTCLSSLSNDTSSINILSSNITDMSLSSFEIIFIAACSSFLTLIFAGLFNFLKINITQQKSQWTPACEPNFDSIIKEIKQSYLSAQQQHEQQQQRASSSSLSLSTSTFPPQNRYYPIVSSAYKLFVEAMNGTERDGWIYLGEKKGVKKYRKDIHASPFSLYRGEKILNYAQNILINAIRDKRIRLLVGDGQMRDCGALEIIDENCKIEFEEYKSPAPFVGAREFVYIDTIHRLADATILSFARSVLHPARPKTSKFTRADLKIAGWAFKKIPDEPHKTKVLYLVRCDLGGAVPSWLVNQITSDIPITVERLNTALEKIGDIEQFNRPIMDVLLYGPKPPIVDDIKDEIKEEIHMGNGHHYQYPSATESQKQRYAAILRCNENDFWSSSEYLNLIPRNDKQWIKRQPILINGTRQQHEELLDTFVIPDGDFEYKSDLEEAFKLFNEWRKWKNGVEWKEKATKEDMVIYSHSLANESIDIIKGEAVIEYTVPVIAGVLLSPAHRKKWDTKLDVVQPIAKLTPYTRLIYLSVKTPTIFITYRDMIAITFIYPFSDGSLIMGSRSVLHDKYPAKKTRVRATIHLDIWHIRPDYEQNISHSLVTHYAHVSLGGALPNWIVNEASIDMPSGILKVRNYIRSIADTLHKPGVLNIPPWPFLKSMGIDIGWMDKEPHLKLSYENNQNIQNATNYEEKKEYVKKSPAVHYVTDRQRTLSGIDNLSTTSSSIRRKKTPNYNLMVANPSNMSSYSSQASNNNMSIEKSSKNALIITRQQWEKTTANVSFRLHEIDNGSDNDKESEYKYSLLNSLSLRDTASYSTLASCAASELLQQTDASSKEYWVPSDGKTPRGIFVYKFIHSGERYYHYMGKAILHHEPSFIYEAICDPSFRFCYDKMLDEMQILNKLDNETYIARYLHTNKQCYIKQERELIVVVRHRVVCPNDKYVAAGMSIEHKLYPTEIGMKYKENNQDNNKRLSGKGPSKSIDSGILRIDVKSSGWVIERNVKKPSDSIVSYITNINFGGSLPSALLKTIAKKQPLAIYHLGKALKQRAKQIRKRKKRQLRAKQQQQILQMQQQQQQQQ